MPGPLEAARAAYGERDPADAARCSGYEWVAEKEGGAFRGDLLGRPMHLRYPRFEASWSESGETVSEFLCALAVYYLATTDGAPVRGEWISFANLPAGGFYVDAWRGYAPGALARHFGDRTRDFERAALRIGARPLALTGDASFVYSALPLVPLAIIHRRGDDEFPASADVLFDASAPHHLPTDCHAILSSQVVAALIAADPSHR